MAVIDTTNLLDSAMLTKAKLPINFSTQNHYIEDLQEKRTADFYYRSNVITLEEEKEKDVTYTIIKPYYTPLQAIIQTVKDDKGKEMSDDWKRLAFERIDHKRRLGKRYRFGYEFEKFPSMTEEEKEFNSSIWITINLNSNSTSTDAVVRRCNTNVLLTGSPTLGYDNITEIRKEPVILESNIQYTSYYKSMVLDVVSGDAYLIAQLNYFTNFIKINDRLIIGNTSSSSRDNNAAYRVKYLNKFASDSTFKVGYDVNLGSVPIVIMSLEKDVVMAEDNLVDRVAQRAPLYKVVSEQTEVGEYRIEYSDTYNDLIMLGATNKYEVKMYNGLIENESALNVQAKLINKDGSIFDGENSSYYDLVQIDGNHFSIKNKQQFNKGVLEITCSGTSPMGTLVSSTCRFELRGIY